MEDYKALIDASKEEMLEMLGQVVAIRSVCSEPVGKKPFGEEVAKALKFMLDRAKEDGFKAKNVSNYAGHIEFKGKNKDVVAAVAHLDIVSEGDLANWNSDPYKIDIRNGKVYGRGVQDDKGPAVMCYYAIKALREAGFKPTKTIRLILGCDEEIAGGGIEHYLEKESAPVAAFTPDGIFPVINGEKGIGVFSLSKKIEKTEKSGVKLCSLKGGIVHNVVPDQVEAVICANNSDMIKDMLMDTAKKKRYSVKCQRSGSTLTVIAKGYPAHASTPEMGRNAISIMMDLLSDIKFNNDSINDFVRFYNNNISFYINGEKMGCKLEDKPSGKLTFNVAMIDVDDDNIKLIVDMRVPVTCKMEETMESIRDVAEKNSLEMEVISTNEALYIDENSDLVKTLLKAYKDNTNDKDAKAVSIGGGTYAKFIPNTLAFGPVMPGGEETCHLANEYMTIDDIMTGAKIYADALYELAK